jgi:hypothetical protein
MVGSDAEAFAAPGAPPVRATADRLAGHPLVGAAGAPVAGATVAISTKDPTFLFLDAALRAVSPLLHSPGISFLSCRKKIQSAALRAFCALFWRLFVINDGNSDQL